MSEERVTLGDVVTPRREKGAPSEHPELPFIGLEHIEAHTMRLLGTVPAGTMRSNANRFYAGDVLYGRLRPYLNKVFVPAFDGYCSAEFIVLPKSEWIDSSFLKFRLNARDFVSFASHLNAGDRPRVDFDQLSSFAFFLPSSLPAQRAIVAKIEELFSELDKGIENLKTAREQLKVYRQALLKHAFEGKLTAQWRAANPDKLEPAAALLARIQTEREQRYRQQLQQWEATGGSLVQRAGKPKAPKPLPPLTAEELAELPELPEGWGWTHLAAVVAVLSGHAFKSGDFLSEGVPVVKIANVGYSEFVEKDQEYLAPTFLDSHSDFIVSPDDLLLALTRPITNNTTKVCRYPKAAPLALLNQRVAALQNAEISCEYIYSFFGTSFFKESIRSRFSETLQPNLSPKDLEACPIPVCSMAEQAQIISELGQRLSETDHLDQTLATSLRQSEALRQSILKRAFSGQLVAQDANDEPAAALLARILAEKQIGDQGAKKSVSRSKRNE